MSQYEIPRKPEVGSMVHYVSHGSPVHEDGTQRYTPQVRAAIVTTTGSDAPGWWNGCVGLAVVNPTGILFDMEVPYSKDWAGGTWHWLDDEE